MAGRPGFVVTKEAEVTGRMLVARQSTITVEIKVFAPYYASRSQVEASLEAAYREAMASLDVRWGDGDAADPS